MLQIFIILFAVTTASTKQTFAGLKDFWKNLSPEEAADVWDTQGWDKKPEHTNVKDALIKLRNWLVEEKLDEKIKLLQEKLELLRKRLLTRGTTEQKTPEPVRQAHAIMPENPAQHQTKPTSQALVTVNRTQPTFEEPDDKQSSHALVKRELISPHHEVAIAHHNSLPPAVASILQELTKTGTELTSISAISACIAVQDFNSENALRMTKVLTMMFTDSKFIAQLDEADLKTLKNVVFLFIEKYGKKKELKETINNLIMAIKRSEQFTPKELCEINALFPVKILEEQCRGESKLKALAENPNAQKAFSRIIKWGTSLAFIAYLGTIAKSLMTTFFQGQINLKNAEIAAQIQLVEARGWKGMISDLMAGGGNKVYQLFNKVLPNTQETINNTTSAVSWWGTQFLSGATDILSKSVDRVGDWGDRFIPNMTAIAITVTVGTVIIVWILFRNGFLAKWIGGSIGSKAS